MVYPPELLSAVHENSTEVPSLYCCSSSFTAAYVKNKSHTSFGTYYMPYTPLPTRHNYAETLLPVTQLTGDAAAWLDRDRVLVSKVTIIGVTYH